MDFCHLVLSASMGVQISMVSVYTKSPHGCMPQSEGSMVDSNAVVSVDGRRQRGERTRQAIIEAALSLQEEGVLVPTAQQISDRAGVLIRSFFRHFEDMETLFKAADDQLRDSYEALFIGGDRQGSLPERIHHAVERRSAAFEQLTNVFLGTKAQLWRYEMLRKNYARNQKGLRKDLEAWLPELNGLPGVECESAHAIASFEMWNRLRSEQGLSEQASIAVIQSTLISLLSAD